MEKITINILAKHFKDSNYNAVTDCPVARAIKEQLQVSYIGCGGHTVYFGKPSIEYSIDGIYGYGYDQYLIDCKASLAIEQSEGDGNAIIRTIELTEYDGNSI
jgi:hypothetical protein